MDRDSQKEDILEVFQFTERLLEVLVSFVPSPQARQYRRVWNRQIRPKLHSVQEQIRRLTPKSSEWRKFDEVGWDPESARLKSDTIAAEAEAGNRETVIELVDTVFDSLTDLFRLHPVKEYKDFVKIFAKKRPEPEPLIQTIFGPGPIPGPDSVK